MDNRETVYETRSHNGMAVKLSERVWKHIVVRHPELDGKMNEVLSIVSNPDEAYMDQRGARHILKKSRIVSDYLAVIYDLRGEGIYSYGIFYKFEKKGEKI